MVPPRIELGSYPRQGYVLPLNYGALIIENKQTLKTLFISSLYHKNETA